MIRRLASKAAFILPVAAGGRSRPGFGGESGTMVVLSLLVGAGAGLGAIGFRYLILAFTELFTGHRDPSALGHFTNPHLPLLGPFVVLFIPVVGGLLYGPLVYRFAPEARGHGVPEVMLAVHSNEGRMRGRVPVVKSLASALCIGAGGSVGREGPIVQIGSAIGSAAGQFSRLSAQELRLLVACGAAGGIAATFNAPIAGVFFALELILRDFQTRSFGLVVLSSVVATAVGRIAFGSDAFLTLPAFHVVSAAEYPLYALLGVLAALAGVGFIRTLYGTEDLADRLWRGPAWLRPAAGGLLLGSLLLVLPEMYGVGYPVLENAIGGQYALGLLAAFLVGKIAATSLTMAIGGSGGVFAPSLFMGAMLGSAFGLGAHELLPAATAGAGAYGLVGMGAVFAAAARAPITAVIIVFELTGDYSIILPLMLAVVIATGLSHRLSTSSIYSLKLKRRGIDIDRPPLAGPLAGVRVGEVMRGAPEPLPADARLTEIAARFAGSWESALPVLDQAGLLIGVIAARDIERATADEGADAASLALPVPELYADRELAEAIELLSGGDFEALPVLADGTRSIAGWLDHRDVLRAYAVRRGGSAAVAERGSAAGLNGPRAAPAAGSRPSADPAASPPPAPGDRG
jgi:CIC family chloride channel protein